MCNGRRFYNRRSPTPPHRFVRVDCAQCVGVKAPPLSVAILAAWAELDEPEDPTVERDAATRPPPPPDGNVIVLDEVRQAGERGAIAALERLRAWRENHHDTPFTFTVSPRPEEDR